MIKRIPLLEEVLKYKEEKNLLFSMPGNKSGRAFLIDEEGKRFADNMGYLDITEVDPLDNLHYPEGVILEAEQLLAETYGVKKAFFVVNGSTAGNMASIFAAFSEGDEILVERNCHKSIYNALILRKLKVIYIEPVVDQEKGIFLPPDYEKINKALKMAKNPKGIILTYPNYFGITYDVEKILQELKKKGMKVILDAAHGAHFGISEKLPKAIYNIPDYVVVSAHKTLPALTQGSYLLVNNMEDDIEFYLRAFMSTSPSYLIMSSLDYARHYLDCYGKEIYEELICKAEKWKKKINLLGKVTILDSSDLLGGYDIDKSRYLITMPRGYSGHKLADYFRENRIQCEMSFAAGVVLILSPCNDEDDFKKIYDLIEKMDLAILQEKDNSNYVEIIPEKVLEPYDVFRKEYKNIKINESEGMVAKEFIVPYPPGIPLVCPGEKISKETIEIVNDYLLNNRQVIGIDENEKIKVIY